LRTGHWGRDREQLMQIDPNVSDIYSNIQLGKHSSIASEYLVMGRSLKVLNASSTDYSS
jgi:hypothetical protein